MSPTRPSNRSVEITQQRIPGRVPPQNLDAEISTLGALLLDPDAIIKVIDSLAPQDFYRPDHATIYEAMVVLSEKRVPIDIVTMADELARIKKLDEVGGQAALSKLVSSVASASNVAHYANIVREKAMLRRLIHAANDIGELGFKEDENADILLDTAEQTLFSVTQRFLKQNFTAVRNILTESFERLDALSKQDGSMRGLPTGFRQLDNILGGLQKSDLIIIAARPSVGKCVTGDTQLVDPQSGSLVRIQDLVKEKQGTITTLTKNWQFSQVEPSDFVNDGIKPVYKVETALGHTIEATLPHPFLTVEGWRSLINLKVGDRIGVAKELPIFGQLTWPAFKIKALAYFLTDGGLTGPTPGFTNNNPKILTDFKATMLEFEGVTFWEEPRKSGRTPTIRTVVDKKAYLDARLTWSQEVSAYMAAHPVHTRLAAQAVGISPSLVSLWKSGMTQPGKEIFEAMQGFLVDFPRPRWFKNHNPVTDFLQEQGIMGKNAHQKSIPQEIFTLRKDDLVLFLNRLFSCDGTAYVAHEKDGSTLPRIAYCSVSSEMIHQVQHLLRRFGILARVREKQVKYKGGRRRAFELEIYGKEDLGKFIERIGIFGKEEAIEKVREAITDRHAGWTKDTLPLAVWKRILQAKADRTWRSVYDELGLPETHNIHVNKREPRRETVKKIAQALGDTELVQVAESDVYWDRIVSIGYQGNKPVYDLTVPDTHNFVANDFVIHNTSLGLNIAEHVAIKEKKTVGIFSLEMSKEQLVDRLISSIGLIDSWKLRNGKLNDDDFRNLNEAYGVLAEANLFIDDAGTASVMEVRAKARRLQAEHGLDLIVVDYLQLMEAPNRSADGRTQEVSEISRSLKALAKELNCPVLALSQLSRAVESRPDKRPMLSDLRESGCLSGDTLIIRADTGERVPIKDLVGKTTIPVWSMNEGGKLVRQIITRVFSSGHKQLFKLKLESGRSIKASGNHKFKNLDDWISLDQLGIGQKLAIYDEKNSDVLWDEIVAIEPLLIEEVFDATVPGNHNFVANDIIVHNSIEQDADVVMFLYREDYYSKENPTNIMEILVRKHRNGPTGDAKVLARLQFSRFETLDTQHLPN